MHTARTSMNVLKDMFPGQVISSGSEVGWPGPLLHIWLSSQELHEIWGLQTSNRIDWGIEGFYIRTVTEIPMEMTHGIKEKHQKFAATVKRE